MMTVVISYELSFGGAVSYSIVLDDLPVLTLRGPCTPLQC